MDMNYYNAIKNELINNEINRKVKNYSINKSDLTLCSKKSLTSKVGDELRLLMLEEY